jgi:hypothetical protein
MFADFKNKPAEAGLDLVAKYQWHSTLANVDVATLSLVT